MSFLEILYYCPQEKDFGSISWHPSQIKLSGFHVFLWISFIPKACLCWQTCCTDSVYIMWFSMLGLSACNSLSQLLTRVSCEWTLEEDTATEQRVLIQFASTMA